MAASNPRISYVHLLGDFLFYLAFYLLAVARHFDRVSLWGTLLAVPSFALWFTAKLHLGASFTPRPEARKLVAHGLYSRIRHPIYFFSTLAMIGTAICLRWWWCNLMIALTVPLQLWRIRLEEKVLREKFGETYLEYRRRTWF
jgi:protein-S-isoprenylcysteine O-methyltransferase Ste14